MKHIPHFTGNVPFITLQQMNQLESLLIEDYGINLMQIQENAGFQIACLARDRFFNKNLSGKKVSVVAGTDSKGAIVMAAARRLKTWDVNVGLILTDPKGKFSKDCIAQFSICQKLNIPVSEDITNTDLIIDGIAGLSLKESIESKISKYIDMVNNSGAPVISPEGPTGLDLDTGKPGTQTVKSNATVALGLPKIGLFKHSAIRFVGELYLADINIPAEVFSLMNIDSESVKKVFHQSALVKINKVIVFS
jgi:NAD(P)H-hydrate epimerase